MDTIMADPRYLELRDNLAYFAGLYQTILAGKKPVAWYLKQDGARGPGKSPPLLASTAEQRDFAAFYDRFYRYVDRENAQVKSALAALPKDSATAVSSAVGAGDTRRARQ
jgi:hypothetical protein